jgi:hypothetical protein
MSATYNYENNPITPYGAKYDDTLFNFTKDNGVISAIKLPTTQQTAFEYNPSLQYFQETNISTNFFQQSNIQKSILKRNQFNRIDRISFEWNLSIANSTANALTTLAPTYAWFPLVTVTLSGGNDVYNNMTPQTKLSWILTVFNAGNLFGKFQEYNINQTPTGFFSAPAPPYPVGNVPSLYYDTFETFINPQFGLFLSESLFDLVFNFTPPPAPGIVTNVVTPGPNGGTALALTSSVITVNSVVVLVDGVYLNDQDTTIEQRDARRSHANVYLSSFIIQQTAVSFAPGVKTVLPLSSLGGRISSLDVYIVPTGGFTNQGPNGTCGQYSNLINVGDEALIDVQTGNGQSIITSAGGIKGRYLLTKYVSQLSNNSLLDQFPAVYRIPFTKNMISAYGGKQDGFYWLDNINSFKVVITPQQSTNQVDTITKSTGALAYTAGYISFRLPWCSDVSDPVLFSATTTQLAAALNNLPYFLANNITAVFSAAFTTTSATITVTYTSPRTAGLGSGTGIRTIKVAGDNLTTSGGQDSPGVATTVFPVNGIPGVGSYDYIIVGQPFYASEYIDRQLSTTQLQNPIYWPTAVADAIAEIQTADYTAPHPKTGKRLQHDLKARGRAAMKNLALQ